MAQRNVRQVRISDEVWLCLAWQGKKVGMQPSTLLRESGRWVCEILAAHPDPIDLKTVLAEATGGLGDDPDQ